MWAKVPLVHFDLMYMKFQVFSPRRNTRKSSKTGVSTISTDVTLEEIDAIASPESMGSGVFSYSGFVESFTLHRASDASIAKVQSDLTETTKDDIPQIIERNFLRHASSFLRVADLDMVETQHSDSSCNSRIPNFHHISVDPPPGIEIDMSERWVVLDDGYGNQSPIAPAAIQALARFGLSTAVDHSMWHPDSKTSKVLSNGSWKGCTFDMDTPMVPHDLDEEILVWSGKFHHNLYGSDLPAVRAAAIIDMSADALMELLVDSGRVQ